MSAQIRKEIAGIQPLDELEYLSQVDVLSWIDSGAELCRRHKPASPPKHLVAYFAVVDDDHILLVDHINAELWLPTGGHVEPGEQPKTTALREAREELSIEPTGTWRDFYRSSIQSADPGDQGVGPLNPSSTPDWQVASTRRIFHLSNREA